MVVDVSPRAVDPRWSTYEYRNTVFMNLVVTGKEIANRLESLRGEAEGYSFNLHPFSSSVRWRRNSGHSKTSGYFALSLPHSIYDLDYIDRLPSSAADGVAPLVNQSCPSFPDYGAALFRLAYDLEYPMGADLPRSSVRVRIATGEAWIDRIWLNPRSISVELNGKHVAGCRLVIGGSAEARADETVGGPGPVELTFSGGVPERVWLVLSRGARWIEVGDIRTARGEDQHWDDIFFAPASSCERVEDLIYQGENDTVEFKQSLPKKEDKFLKTVAAFANGKGGTLIAGVENGTGDVTGVDEEVKPYGGIGAYKDMISNRIHDKVSPEPDVHIEHCEVAGKNVVAVTVYEGSHPPYGLKRSGAQHHPTFYIRRNATTFVVSQGEIRAMARKRSSDAETAMPWLVR